MSKEALNIIKKNLEYTEEDMKIFLENEKNIEGKCDIKHQKRILMRIWL